MAWYNLFQKDTEHPFGEDPEEKANPAQGSIGGGGPESTRENTFKYKTAYETIEVVNRGVNIIVDDAAEIPSKVGDKLPIVPIVKGMQAKKLHRLLNHEPNPFQDINSFRRNLVIDMIMDGNIFIYFDGVHLYHLPAENVKVVPSETTFVKMYTYDDKKDFYPEEIIHIKENSFNSIFRGTSRLKSAERTMTLMRSMKTFQDNFFQNGAVPGLVLKSPNTLSDKIKNRMIAAWVTRFNPSAGGRRPLILDGGLEVDPLTKINFTDLDFQSSIADNEKIILKALGVPPILLDSGNNANLRPNLRLYYLETVLPIVRKLNFGIERFFGFQIAEDVTNIPAVQPELREQSQYWSSLVNGGVAYVNEARSALGMPPDKDPSSNELRIPANIAGSASNPDEGGRPTGTEE